MNEPMPADMNESDAQPESNGPMQASCSIPFPDAADSNLKDGEEFTGTIKGTLSMQDGKKMLVVEAINDQPVGADTDQEEGEEPDDSNEEEPADAEEALARFMKRNKGKGIQ